MNDNSSKVLEVDINEILPNRFQPRRQFDEQEILELSDSIKEHGIIQPIVVRTIGDKYEIIAGERRYKASVLAGKETVPVIIKNLNDKDSAEIALIENIQRKNLTPIEEALSYKKILDMGYITQEELAIKFGKSQSSIANKIRLLNLSDDVQEALLESKISERHARSLLRLKTSKEQNEMLNRIINERLTVRKTDEEIDKLNKIEEHSLKEEKGELNMNNNINQDFNIFGTPSVQSNNVTQPTLEPVAPVPQIEPSQSIFGGMQSITPEIPTSNVVEPLVEPVAPVTQMEPSQSIFGGMQSITPEMPTSNVVEPLVEPVAPVSQMEPSQSIFGGMQSVTTEMPIPNVVEPLVEPVASVPQMEPSQSIFGGMQFDANGMVISDGQQPLVETQTPVTPVPQMEVPQPMFGGIQSVTTEMPTNNVIEPSVEPIVPVTSPIIEDNSNIITSDTNLFNFNSTTPVNQSTTIAEEAQTGIKIPEPIIITDYSKQYDPIMPQTAENMVPVVDFKEVINAIRECSNKIEQYGFKIDVEEFDLANLYQVIFKIEK